MKSSALSRTAPAGRSTDRYRSMQADEVHVPAIDPELRPEPTISLATVHGSIMLSLKAEGAQAHWSGD
ncbi:MAG: hypothetical protein WBA87_01560 [Microbacterium sp.]